ncbi:FtsX-like permease family protein [Streptomyces goshikiensis]|uniref:FtsX-like permease family protein n=1 Tax=Streptomyces goshikiensis TaxID=1942 RepID=UPI00378BC000
MTTPPPGPPPGPVPPRRTPRTPWVRTRLRATPTASLLAAALAFVAVLLAAGLPRALDRGADRALRDYLSDKGPTAASLYATAGPRPAGRSAGELDSVLDVLRARTGDGFGLVPGAEVHGSLGLKTRSLTNPELPQPEAVPVALGLGYLKQAPEHTRLAAGRWPDGAAPGKPVEVALSQRAAETLNVRVGTVLNAAPSVTGAASAEVVGLYEAADEADPYWGDLPCLTRACLRVYPSSLPKNYWQTFALVGAGGLERLVQWGGGATDFWRLPVDTGSLHVHELPETRRQVAAYVSGPTATQLTRDANRGDLRISSRLPALFEEAEARRQAAAPLTAIGPAGVAGVALVVFCLAAALTGDRRETELTLLLARGGSRPGILRRLLGESAVTVLPGAVLATALAVSLLPTPRSAPALLAASATALFALLAFPVRALVLLSPRRGRPAARRRLVGELLVLAATAAAVYEVRSRGIAPAGQGVDPLLIAAPLLLALSGGLLLARVQPPLMGALARSAGRGSGVIGFLGLARAARGAGGRGRPSVLPLVALLLAVTTAGFGANVLTAVDGSRAQAARQSVGGDARIAAAAGDSLPPALTEAATARSGVRTGLSVWTDSEAFLFGAGGQGSPRITVVVADPVAYAELARAVGRGQFDPGLLAGGPEADAPVPALFSKDLAAKATEDGYRLRLGGGEELRARPVGEFDGTPALPGAGAATIVLPAGPVLAHVPRATKPDLWFGLGPVADARLRALVRETVPAAVAERLLIQTSEATAAELGRDPLQASAGRIFWGSVAAAAVFALLALLITLARAAPERAASLARLRTMGLRPRQGIALILAEALPQAVAAACGGGLLAAAAVALLGPAVDLSSLVGTPVPTGLRVLPRPLTTQTLALAALAVLAVLAEAAVSGRRQITTELRAGDSR